MLILVGGVNCQVDSPGVALVDLKKQIAQEFNLPVLEHFCPTKKCLFNFFYIINQKVCNA